jgi:hypothetical protein
VYAGRDSNVYIEHRFRLAKVRQRELEFGEPIADANTARPNAAWRTPGQRRSTALALKRKPFRTKLRAGSVVRNRAKAFNNARVAEADSEDALAAAAEGDREIDAFS